MDNKLTVTFDLVDMMSRSLEAIANTGEDVIEMWERMGLGADSAQEVGVASSAEIATAISDYDTAIEGAASSTDYWTDKIGGFDKSAMEAIYTTQELVNMGYKTAEALNEEASVMELAERATSDLNEAINDSAESHEKCMSAIEKAAQVAEEAAKSDQVSEEAKEALQKATEQTSAAFEELEAAQKAAQEAMDNYNSVAESGTATIAEQEEAALKAADAADNLVAANQKAANASDELTKATESTAESLDNAGDKGVNAVETIAEALAGAGITATVKEISESVYELADAFSEAESTVVLATGATGDALDSLTDSMMAAYAASKTGSLSDTAAVIGEVNTRLGYTGDELTETTELFLDFAAVTGGNAASSVKSVTQLMNQWNIDASDMESVLSKLTYAGQASGISVDSLTSNLTSNKAILDQLGFSLEESIALFESFELSGTQSASVMTGFRTALTSGTISSVEELYEVLEKCATGEISAADAADIFGSRAATTIVAAAQNGVFALDDMVTALENSSGTLATTAEAAQTLSQKWEQANNNISSAFTSAVEPAINSTSSVFADLVNKVGDYLNEHPTVVKAITAVGVGIGTVTAAFGLYAVGQAVATAATALFGTTLSAAIWPLTLVAAAVAAVTAAVMIGNNKYDEAYESIMSMTSATEKQTEELKSLQTEYDKACETYGETSAEASRLKYQIDDLTDYISKNGQSVEELCAEVDALVEKHDELKKSYEDATSAIKDEEINNLALIAKLESLASSTNGTAESQKAMQTIIDELNSSIDGLNLNYADLIVNQEMTIQTARELASTQSEQELVNQKWERYVDLIGEAGEAETVLADITAEVAGKQEKYDEVYEAYLNRLERLSLSGSRNVSQILLNSDEYAAYKAASDALDEVTQKQEEAQNKLEEINDEMAALEKELGFVVDDIEESEKATLSYQQAAAYAYQSVQEEIEDLCAAYGEAYDAALASFEGQFGLFDEASASLDSTVENAQAALDAQLAYWEEYNANLQTLTEYGSTLTDEARANYEALLEYASDGSEEAAGLAASMAEAIEAGDTETIERLSQTLADVSAAQEAAATTTADFVTDFDAQMDELVSKMGETIDELELEDEAKEAAKATIDAYAQAILDGRDDAVAAAQAVSEAVSGALSGSYTGASATSSVTGYAVGTKNAEPGLALVGEDGPELIDFGGGEVVYTNSETEQILNNYNNITGNGGEGGIYYYPVESDEPQTSLESSGSGDKKITLEIEGKGNIQLQGGKVDEDTMIMFLYEYLKPVLSEILQQEIYEEGDYNYGY